jgi:hypothetical protein
MRGESRKMSNKDQSSAGKLPSKREPCKTFQDNLLAVDPERVEMCCLQAELLCQFEIPCRSSFQRYEIVVRDPWP